MTALIIRSAVQRAMDEEKRSEEYRRMEFTQPHWHSTEAKEAWVERKPITRGGILLPLKDSDWFAMGYDAAMAEIESRDLLDRDEN